MPPLEQANLRTAVRNNTANNRTFRTEIRNQETLAEGPCGSCATRNCATCGKATTTAEFSDLFSASMEKAPEKEIPSGKTEDGGMTTILVNQVAGKAMQNESGLGMFIQETLLGSKAVNTDEVNYRQTRKEDNSSVINDLSSAVKTVDEITVKEIAKSSEAETRNSITTETVVAITESPKAAIEDKADVLTVMAPNGVNEKTEKDGNILQPMEIEHAINIGKTETQPKKDDDAKSTCDIAPMTSIIEVCPQIKISGKDAALKEFEMQEEKKGQIKSDNTNEKFEVQNTSSIVIDTIKPKMTVVKPPLGQSNAVENGNKANMKKDNNTVFVVTVPKTAIPSLEQKPTTPKPNNSQLVKVIKKPEVATVKKIPAEKVIGEKKAHNAEKTKLALAPKPKKESHNELEQRSKKAQPKNHQAKDHKAISEAGKATEHIKAQKTDKKKATAEERKPDQLKLAKLEKKLSEQLTNLTKKSLEKGEKENPIVKRKRETEQKALEMCIRLLRLTKRRKTIEKLILNPKNLRRGKKGTGLLLRILKKLLNS